MPSNVKDALFTVSEAKHNLSYPFPNSKIGPFQGHKIFYNKNIKYYYNKFVYQIIENKNYLYLFILVINLYKKVLNSISNEKKFVNFHFSVFINLHVNTLM